MNWPKLFLKKETYATTGYKKVEWTATLVEVEGAKYDTGFVEGGTAKKLGTARCELEAQGAFAPECRGELRVSAEGLDFWSDYSNDKVGFEGNDKLRVRLDEPSILLDGQPVVTIEKARGKASFLLLGVEKSGQFLGYLPASLKPGGVMTFLFGSSATTPWFVPAREPWGGKKVIEAAKAPAEIGKALADAEAWKAVEAACGDLMNALFAARMLLAALQCVRYG